MKRLNGRKRFVLFFLFIMSAFPFLCRASNAIPPVLYVNDTLFHGEVFIGGDNKFYVELSPLLQTLDMKPPAPYLRQKMRNGKIFVSLSDFAKEIQMDYLYNSATKIADLTVIRPFISAPREAPPAGKSKETKKVAKNEKSPVDVTLENAATDYRTGGYGQYYPAVRIYTKVRNISAKTVVSATFRCEFLDLYGKPFSTDTQAVSNVAPGESQEAVFFWNNSATPSAVAYKVYLTDWTLAGESKTENPDKDKPVLEGQH